VEFTSLSSLKSRFFFASAAIVSSSALTVWDVPDVCFFNGVTKKKVCSGIREKETKSLGHLQNSGSGATSCLQYAYNLEKSFEQRTRFSI
jgi:NAD(P)H-nitrite reductase large subunit